MVHYHSLLGADRKTKVGAGNREQVHGVLHVFRTTGIEGIIISEQEVTELVKGDLGLGLKASQVEQLAIRSVSDVDAWVGVLEGICQHGCEHHAEQCWSQHTALFHSVFHWGVDDSPLSRTLSLHAVMELTDQRDESVRASKLTHGAPEAIAADGIRWCTGQHSILALLLQQTSSKHRVDGSTLISEAALALWKQAILQVFDEVVQEDSR